MAIKGYRTLLFSLVVVIAGVLQMVDWTTIIPQGRTWTGGVMTAIVVIMMVLRSFTNTPMGQKES